MPRWAGLKCSVEFSEQCSDVEREVSHDEMTQECATEYSEVCSTAVKEECLSPLDTDALRRPLRSARIAPALLMPLTLRQEKSPAFFLQDKESEEFSSC